jgi:hypothetical protein
MVAWATALSGSEGFTLPVATLGFGFSLVCSLAGLGRRGSGWSAPRLPDTDLVVDSEAYGRGRAVVRVECVRPRTRQA